MDGPAGELCKKSIQLPAPRPDFGLALARNHGYETYGPTTRAHIHEPDEHYHNLVGPNLLTIYWQITLLSILVVLKNEQFVYCKFIIIEISKFTLNDNELQSNISLTFYVYRILNALWTVCAYPYIAVVRFRRVL